MDKLNYYLYKSEMDKLNYYLYKSEEEITKNMS